MYKLINSEVILKEDEGLYIPRDVDNRHYLEFLEWEATQPQPLVYKRPFAEIAAEKSAELVKVAEAIAESYIINYPGFERNSWPVQEAEATLWYSKPEEERTPDLVPWCATALTKRKGESLEEFIALIWGNVLAFRVVSAEIAGARQRVRKYMDTLVDEQLDYDALASLDVTVAMETALLEEQLEPLPPEPDDGEV
jgi:hypothetical protein